MEGEGRREAVKGRGGKVTGHLCTTREGLTDEGAWWGNRTGKGVTQGHLRWLGPLACLSRGNVCFFPSSSSLLAFVLVSSFLAGVPICSPDMPPLISSQTQLSRDPS